MNTLIHIEYLIKNIVNFIDEISTNEPDLDLDFSLMEHCKNNTFNLSDVKPIFNLNLMDEEVIYLKQEFRLNSNCTFLNEEIYNLDMSKYLLIRVESLK